MPNIPMPERRRSVYIPKNYRGNAFAFDSGTQTKETDAACPSPEAARCSADEPSPCVPCAPAGCSQRKPPCPTDGEIGEPLLLLLLLLLLSERVEDRTASMRDPLFLALLLLLL